MNNLELYLAFIAFLGIPFFGIAHIAWKLNNELHEANVRLLTLSSTLQRVEYTTNKPWYTSSGRPNKIESANWLYSIYKEKLKQLSARRGRRHQRQNDVIPNFE